MADSAMPGSDPDHGQRGHVRFGHGGGRAGRRPSRRGRRRRGAGELALVPDSRTPSKLPERSVSRRVLAGAAFAVYVAGLAVALGRGAIVVIAVTAVVGAVVAA